MRPSEKITKQLTVNIMPSNSELFIDCTNVICKIIQKPGGKTNHTSYSTLKNVGPLRVKIAPTFF